MSLVKSFSELKKTSSGFSRIDGTTTHKRFMSRKLKAKEGSVATVFGATGFLGRYVVSRLAKNGAQVVVPFRGEEKGYNHLKVCGEVGQIVPLRYSIRDHDLIDKAVAHSNVVINLLGARWETRNFSFADVHVEATRAIATACKNHFIERVVHMSAAGADINSSSKWASTKAEGEQIIRSLVPHATIIRPTWMFGDGDRLVTNFCRMLDYPLPLFVLPSSNTFQPVYVRDVASVVMSVLENNNALGNTFELGGPHIYTYGDFMDYIIEETRRYESGGILEVPEKLAKVKELFVRIMELSRRPILTRDQLQFLSERNWIVSSDAKDFKFFGITPAAVTEIPHNVTRLFEPGVGV